MVIEEFITEIIDSLIPHLHQSCPLHAGRRRVPAKTKTSECIIGDSGKGLFTVAFGLGLPPP